MAILATRAEARLATDSEEQLTDLMSRYETPLFRFLFVLLGDRDTATDCAQDTFVRAYDNLRRGRPVTAGWLYKVARNRAMDEFRRKRREGPALDALEALPATGEIAPEASAAMQQAFAHLPADDRLVLYLVAVEGLGGLEIAEMLGIKPNAARMRICRARERFRLAYGGAG
jgi:RNA polymerase sigma-70 factor (ECF subfamily)